LEFQFSHALQADPSKTLNPDTIHSELDDTVSREMLPSLMLKLNRGKSLPASWSPKVAPGTIVPDTDETIASALPHRWDLDDDRAKMSPSTNPKLDVDDDPNGGWKLVPYFGAMLLFFSWIVQNGFGTRKRKAARLKFEPACAQTKRANFTALREGMPDLANIATGLEARPPALNKLAAAFSIAGEGQQKAADEKTPALLEHVSGDPDVEKARTEFEHAQEIEEIFHKDFDGIGLS